VTSAIDRQTIAFGPVPSRRLGRSLGINNVPPKACSYSCVYCQLGRTTNMQIDRVEFHAPEKILQSVRGKVERASETGEPIDYLTFVSDGEPTLDINLAREIDLLSPLGKIAVITNSSLLWREDVREALTKADWVSLKVDAVREVIWRRLDRPHGALRLKAILDGAIEFAGEFEGELATETMLVEGVNDGVEHLGEVADIITRLQPGVAYLSIPVRPPAEPWVRPPGEGGINRAYQVLYERVSAGQGHIPVEYLIGYEGNEFACTGDVESDLLGITAVHPMREDAVIEFLARVGADRAVVRELVEQGRLVETLYAGRRFYVKKIC
jgi:wyosine [tRNA(Phe)-imidazoG37] synthetase (radical SAM superfamily)